MLDSTIKLDYGCSCFHLFYFAEIMSDVSPEKHGTDDLDTKIYE